MKTPLVLNGQYVLKLNGSNYSDNAYLKGVEILKDGIYLNFGKLGKWAIYQNHKSLYQDDIKVVFIDSKKNNLLLNSNCLISSDVYKFINDNKHHVIPHYNPLTNELSDGWMMK